MKRQSGRIVGFLFWTRRSREVIYGTKGSTSGVYSAQARGDPKRGFKKIIKAEKNYNAGKNRKEGDDHADDRASIFQRTPPASREFQATKRIRLWYMYPGSGLT